MVRPAGERRKRRDWGTRILKKSQEKHRLRVVGGKRFRIDRIGGVIRPPTEGHYTPSKGKKKAKDLCIVFIAKEKRSAIYDAFGKRQVCENPKGGRRT